MLSKRYESIETKSTVELGYLWESLDGESGPPAVALAKQSTSAKMYTGIVQINGNNNVHNINFC